MTPSNGEQFLEDIASRSSMCPTSAGKSGAPASTGTANVEHRDPVTKGK
jgi:hypothetical protein